MARLIDADAFKTRLEHEAFGRGRVELLRARDIADETPTIDAVPVIRCYECKYFREFEKGFSTNWDGSCQYWNTHSTVYSNFCGCGARMTPDEKI